MQKLISHFSFIFHIFHMVICHITVLIRLPTCVGSDFMDIWKWAIRTKIRFRKGTNIWFWPEFRTNNLYIEILQFLTNILENFYEGSFRNTRKVVTVDFWIFIFLCFYSSTKTKIAFCDFLNTWHAINRPKSKNSNTYFVNFYYIPKIYVYANFQETLSNLKWPWHLKGSFFYISVTTLYFCLLFTSILAPTAILQMSIKFKQRQVRSQIKVFSNP